MKNLSISLAVCAWFVATVFFGLFILFFGEFDSWISIVTNLIDKFGNEPAKKKIKKAN